MLQTHTRLEYSWKSSTQIASLTTGCSSILSTRIGIPAPQSPAGYASIPQASLKSCSTKRYFLHGRLALCHLVPFVFLLKYIQNVLVEIRDGPGRFPVYGDKSVTIDVILTI